MLYIIIASTKEIIQNTLPLSESVIISIMKKHIKNKERYLTIIFLFFKSVFAIFSESDYNNSKFKIIRHVIDAYKNSQYILLIFLICIISFFIIIAYFILSFILSILFKSIKLIFILFCIYLIILFIADVVMFFIITKRESTMFMNKYGNFKYDTSCIYRETLIKIPSEINLFICSNISKIIL